MSITYEGEDTASPRTSTVNVKGVVTSTRSYLYTTTEICSEFDIGTQATCPKIGSVHPDNPAMWCVSVTITNSNPWKGWGVVAEYSSEREINENPLDDRAKIRFGTEQFQMVAVKDRNGKAIVNSAGDPPDPPVMRDNSRRVAYIQKNVSAVPIWLLDYEDAVNDDVFLIRGYSVEVGQANGQRVELGDAEVRNSTTFYSLTMELHFSEAGWNTFLLDAGFRRIYSGSLRENITYVNSDGEAEYPVAPVPLDGAGVEIVDPTLDSVVINEFENYNTRPFAIFTFLNE